MNKLYINQICPRYAPLIGGVETCVKEISERLDKTEYRIKVFTLNTAKKLPREEIINRIPVKRYYVWPDNGPYYLPSISMIRDISRQADAIHVHNVHGSLSISAKLAAGSKIPLVISPYYHGRGNTMFAEFMWLPFRAVIKRILQSAEVVIVNANAQKDLLEDSFGYKLKTHVIYDGARVQEIKVAKPIVVDSNIKVVLYVGRLEQYKNIQVAIKALQYLPKNYHFYVIGDGPYKQVIEDIIQKLDLVDRVHLLGFQPDNIVHNWMKRANVFVQLSAVESFGMTCIESLAANVPVVANDDGYGLAETISLYPQEILKFSVCKEHIKKLSEKIMEASTMKPTRANVDRFSWDFIVNEINLVYKQVLEN